MEPSSSDQRYVRTVDHVKQVIQHAKLEEKDIRPLTQVLYFADQFPEHRILELEKEVFQTLKKGEKLIFRGQKNDKAVLCTKNKTFDIKEAETSNSVVLIPELKFAEDIKAELGERFIEVKQVVGVYHAYYELKLIRPRLLKLKKLLSKKPFKGIEHEETDKSGDDYYTLDKLLDHVQASEEELKEGLVEIGAFCDDGYWRLLERDYNFRIMAQLFNLIESNSWVLDQVPIGESLSELEGIIPKHILHHLFQLYFEPLGAYSESGDEYFKLKESAICRFLGTYFLHSADKFNLDEFMVIWKESVPEGVCISLEQLAGLAVVSRESKPPKIWFFDEEDLPEDPQERFNALFNEKPRWTYDEIAPYIKRLATEKQTINALLTKYCRTSNAKGVKYFCARHGK